MKSEVLKIPAKVGMMSLVNTGNARPCSFGNYFWFRDPEARAVNMWAENLNSAVERGILDDGMVEVRLYESRDSLYALVIDPRLPKEWLYNELCFTGMYPPHLDAVSDMYQIVGDPNNQLEQYTNPEKYWEARSCKYVNGTVYTQFKDGR